MTNPFQHQIEAFSNSLDLANMKAPHRHTDLKNIALVSVLIILFLTVGCAQQNSNQPTARRESNQLTEEKKAAIADTMEVLIGDVHESFKTLNNDEYLDHFSQNLGYIFQGSTLSYKEYQSIMTNYMNGIQKVSIDTVGSPNVKVLSRDNVVVSFNYENERVNSEGDTTKSGGIISAVTTREEDGWKVVHAHETLEN